MKFIPFIFVFIIIGCSTHTEQQTYRKKDMSDDNYRFLTSVASIANVCYEKNFTSIDLARKGNEYVRAALGTWNYDSARFNSEYEYRYLELQKTANRNFCKKEEVNIYNIYDDYREKKQIIENRLQQQGYQRSSSPMPVYTTCYNYGFITNCNSY